MGVTVTTVSKRFHIASTRLRILLLKAVPGADGDVRDELRRRIGDDRGIFHFAAGDFDVVALLLEKEDDEATRGALPNILHARDVRCFAILGEGQTEQHVREFLDRVRHKFVLMYTFIRTRSIFCSDSREPPDESFWESWRAKQTAEPVDELLLSTFGQPEFVLLRARDTISSVLDSVLAVGAREPTVDKTFSLVAINSNASRVEACAETTSLAMQISVSCAPRDVSGLLHACQASLQNSGAFKTLRPYVLPGANDFIVIGEFHDESRVMEAIDSVLVFRKLYQKRLFNTRTRFLRPNDEALVSPEVEREPSSFQEKETGDKTTPAKRLRYTAPCIELNDKQASQIYGGLLDLGPSVIRALHAAGNLLHNELLVDDFVDVANSVIHLRKCAISLATEDPPKDIASDQPKTETVDWLRHSLRQFRIGLQQRTGSSYAGTNPKEPTVSHLVGGFQKVLQAAEAVPWSVWREQMKRWGHACDHAWTGYVIFEPGPSFETFPNGAIRIAEIHRLRPQDWTPLLHEIGHQIYGHVARNVSCMIDEIVNKAVHSLGSGWSEEFIRNLAKEAIADLCQAIYGPVWNRRLVLLGHWNDLLSYTFVSELRQPKVEEYVIRSMLCYTCLQAMNESRDWNNLCVGDFAAYRTGYLSLHDAAQWRGRQLDSFGWAKARCEEVLKLIHQAEDDRFQQLFTALVPMVQVAVSHIYKVDVATIEKRREYWSGPCTKAVESVKQGVPAPTEQLQFPELFLWRLRLEFGEDMPYAPTAAVILSLRQVYRNIIFSYLPETEGSSALHP